MRVLNETGPVEGPDFPDQWRLLVDGVPIGPWEAQADAFSIEVSAATEVRVGFVIPTDAGELVLQVGDPTEEPGLIPIELPKLP